MNYRKLKNHMGVVLLASCLAATAMFLVVFLLDF